MTYKKSAHLQQHDSNPPVATLLERWHWFDALSPELRLLAEKTVIERHAAAGEYLARAGDPAANWYGVISGYLQMYVVGPDGSETTLYCLPEGEWGGDGSLLRKERLKYDLRALTSTHMLQMPAATFEELREHSIAFNHYLCEVMNARMGTFVGMLVASRLLGPEMSVARALLMLAEKSQSESQELSISQQEIALISGLSRQRVNMALSILQEHGIVRTEARKGQILVHLLLLRQYVVGGGTYPAPTSV